MSQSLQALTGTFRALFFDLDGTLTTDGVVASETYASLQKVKQAGIKLVLVTGRPAGWGQALMTLAPLDAVVTENGGLSFVRVGSGTKKVYGVPETTLPEWRRKMHAAAVDVITEHPGARMSTDSQYREVDLAIDWNEHVSIPMQAADDMVLRLREQGFAAVKSSVHVNFGPPKFNKLSACMHIIEHVLEADPTDLSSYVYVGDALNDAPMFGKFPNSVGVANVKKWWDQLEHKPAMVTEQSEGAGLRQVIEQMLKIRALKRADI